MLSLKFYLNQKTFDRVMSKHRTIRFFETPSRYCCHGNRVAGSKPI